MAPEPASLPCPALPCPILPACAHASLSGSPPRLPANLLA